MKLAVVTSIPTPYRDPFWGVVSALPHVDLDVYYCAQGKSDRPWTIDWNQDFNHFSLPSRNLLPFRRADAAAFWVDGLQKRLCDGNYDAVIIGGYNHPCMLFAMWTCRKRNVPFFLVCETYQIRNRGLSRLRRLFVQRLCRIAAGGLPTGTLATRFLRAHGMPKSRTIRMPNVPNVPEWTRNVAQQRTDQSTLRKSLGVAEGSDVVVFVGRLIKKKRPELLIRAFAAAAVPKAVLVLVGDGPLIDDCRKIAAELTISDRVLFPGFCQRDEIERWFAISSLFVLPSSETWGVAAIEAQASGLPVILSDEVGSHPEVVRTPANGEVVPAGSSTLLSEAIVRCLSRHHCPDAVLQAATQLETEFRYSTLAVRLIDGIRNNISANFS